MRARVAADLRGCALGPLGCRFVGGQGLLRVGARDAATVVDAASPGVAVAGAGAGQLLGRIRRRRRLALEVDAAVTYGCNEPPGNARFGPLSHNECSDSSELLRLLFLVVYGSSYES